MINTIRKFIIYEIDKDEILVGLEVKDYMDELKEKIPYKKCPHCGYDEFYIKERVSGIVHFNYKYNGDLGDNSEVYDHINSKRIGKYAYCTGCNRKLFKVSK